MLHHINFPAVSRRPLMYPTGNQLWTQTLIGRSPNPVVSNWLFDQELWVLPNTPLSIDRTVLVIFVTSQGLVSFRNVSRRNIVKIIYEEYLPHERLGPC